MASIQNITSDDFGVRFVISFEYSADNGVTIPWTSFTAEFPRDFGDININDQEPAFLELAMAVARGQGHDV